MLLADLREHPLDLGRAGHRSPHHPDVQAAFDQAAGLFLGGVVRVEAVEQDRGAALGEPLDDHPADASRAAGDQCDPSGELQVPTCRGVVRAHGAIPAATKSTTLPKVS